MAVGDNQALTRLAGPLRCARPEDGLHLEVDPRLDEVIVVASRLKLAREELNLILSASNSSKDNRQALSATFVAQKKTLELGS